MKSLTHDGYGSVNITAGSCIKLELKI